MSLRIQASNRFLSYDGDAEYALDLVDSIRGAYGPVDMPRGLQDFLFNIEVALQNADVLTEDFGGANHAR